VRDRLTLPHRSRGIASPNGGLSPRVSPGSRVQALRRPFDGQPCPAIGPLSPRHRPRTVSRRSGGTGHGRLHLGQVGSPRMSLGNR